MPVKRRITRGLFVTNEGKRINADINGSLNILRRYVNSKTNLKIAMNNGREQRQIKRDRWKLNYNIFINKKSIT